MTWIWRPSCQFNSNPTFNYPLSSFRQNNCNSKIHCDNCLFEIPLFEIHHSWFLSQKLLFPLHYFPDLHRPFYHQSTRAFILYKHIASFWQDLADGGQKSVWANLWRKQALSQVMKDPLNSVSRMTPSK